MDRPARVAQRMASLLMAAMVVQALLGLLSPDQYRDVDWIKATWYGNDWTTLVGAVPLLWLGMARAHRGSVRERLLVLGVAGYAVYNYAFYLFGAALNVFFPLYAACFLLGTATLAAGLSRLDITQIAGSFRRATPVRLVGGYLVFVAAGLSVVWLGMWGAYAFAGRPTPIEPEAFKVVAALDLCLMVPALASGGVMLWRRRPWGYLIATVAAIQGSLYLLVLSVNSAIAVSRGLVAAPGELPVWAPLTLCTMIAAGALLASAAGQAAELGHRSRS
jgi:hypothetical protein